LNRILFRWIYTRLLCRCFPVVVVLLADLQVVESVIVLLLCADREGATRQRHRVVHASTLACDWIAHM
jgi:hypothetical protein